MEFPQINSLQTVQIGVRDWKLPSELEYVQSLVIMLLPMSDDCYNLNIERFRGNELAIIRSQAKILYNTKKVKLTSPIYPLDLFYLCDIWIHEIHAKHVVCQGVMADSIHTSRYQSIDSSIPWKSLSETANQIVVLLDQGNL